MRETVKIQVEQQPDISLRSIGEGDLEHLRIWKNAHRDAFFHKAIITPEQQQGWYRSYVQRSDDFMFVINWAGEDVGCIGFRRLEQKIDIYNVIMGNTALSGRGIMRQALHALITEASRRFPGLPLTLMVLKNNPAVSWYLKSGFTVASECDTYLNLLYPVASTQQ